MRWRAHGWLCLGVVLLLLCGCQRLHFEKNLTVKFPEVKTFEISAPGSAQKVELKVTATEPVAVFLVLGKELLEAEQKSGQFDKAKALAGKVSAKDETLLATVPAGEKFGVVLIGGPKSSEVKLVLDGR